MNLHDTLQRVLAEFDEKFEYANERPALMGKGDAKIFISQAITESLKEAFAVLRIEKTYEEIAIFTEKLDTAIMRGEVMEGFKDEEEMRKAIAYGMVEMKILQAIEEKRKAYFHNNEQKP